MMKMARMIAMEMMMAEMAMVGRVSGTIIATGCEEKVESKESPRIEERICVGSKEETTKGVKSTSETAKKEFASDRRRRRRKASNPPARLRRKNFASDRLEETAKSVGSTNETAKEERGRRIEGGDSEGRRIHQQDSEGRQERNRSTD